MNLAIKELCRALFIARPAAATVWLTGLAALIVSPVVAQAAPTCERTLTANVVAIDQPLTFNRLGASNINGMVYALKHDVINKTTKVPLSMDWNGAVAGNVELRPDKRPRPLILRVAEGDCLDITLTNLLTVNPNPFDIPHAGLPEINVFIDEQVAGRMVGLSAPGMQLRGGISSDGSNVGNNASSLAAPGQTKQYQLFATKEGVHVLYNPGSVVGADANQGNTGNGLFGQIIVAPHGSRIYRNVVTEEDMRLSIIGATPKGLPRIDYEARYPNQQPWIAEGKAGHPILNTIDTANNEIWHSDLDAVVAGGCDDGSWNCTYGTDAAPYPLEKKGQRNPTVPNRLEAHRDFAQAWHDEPSAAQAFPGFYVTDPVFRYVLAGVKDGFMINYGSGGIGSEIIANRLGVGPMHDCLSCAYEEFFLTSYTVGDPAMLVDIPANAGLETLLPGQAPPPGTTGPKANFALYPADVSNVNHSYIGDGTKFRNTHIGKEQHVFHLHNHQWLYNPNDDNSNYLDAQSVGPGSSYTYEINFGGSGNRNKSAGDAIYHCHFYPHFAQGMWHHWRNHDVLETGTLLHASVTGDVTVAGKPGTFHNVPFELFNGRPADGARALPDGEIAWGTPIPAVVPLPGKGLPPLPATAYTRVNPLTTTDGLGAVLPVGSLAVVPRAGVVGADNKVGTADDKNPGYPFWVAGIEDIVGQRPPTPPGDMATALDVAMAKAENDWLFADMVAGQADGWDGGLRRHALKGVAAGGHALTTTTPIDFSKVVEESDVQYYPEMGTDIEHVAMAFHAIRQHPSDALRPDGSVIPDRPFITNGSKPAVGAMYHEPCVDDQGDRMADGAIGDFFGVQALETKGASAFTADNPRHYKGANMQFDVILNKTGHHYPQQRIIALWEDVMPTIDKVKAPEPLVMRLNTFDCAVYSHTNLVPEAYEMDDYQVRTPTDIIGQHIHLPKWDLTTTDGAANGWNYEDGTLSPGAIRERIHAIRHFNHCEGVDSGDARDGTDACPVATVHPYFGQFAHRDDWIGARTTLQRWFADPVVNIEGVDRGLGIIFTHDHSGPSTHQQIGLYATVLAEPAGSTWVHNETGEQLGAGPDGTGGRMDGGPTSWQAQILPPASALNGSTVKAETLEPYREFYFEFSDFQHAYEDGVYVGAGPDGRPLPGATPLDRFTGVGAIEDAFRFAINPPAREQFNAPLYPNLVLEAAGGQLPGCPARPCPQAIDVQDPGMFVVNYRAEPVGLRVFDPNKTGPDGKPGMQADGIAGDLAFALSTELRDKAGDVTSIKRAIPELNTVTGKAPAGYLVNQGAEPNDPFTPMLRAYEGDLVRVKIQAGAHEEEHNATIMGAKWLQAGSGHGKAPNSGWRNSQAAGISEQFTWTVPLRKNPQAVKGPVLDYAYNIDASMDGWWSGTWGLVRTYDTRQNNLVALPSNPDPKPDRIVNRQDFNGICPVDAPVVNMGVVAILANELLPKPGGVTIVPAGPNGTTAALNAQHVGGPLNSNGGTLVYNPRGTTVSGLQGGEEGGTPVSFQGPLHDPTAMLYVRVEDLVAVNPKSGSCKDQSPNKRTGDPGMPGVVRPDCQVKLKPGQKVEPLILRAEAGSCINVTLYNRIPALAPDLPTLSTLIGVVKRDRNVVNGGINIGSTPFDTNLIRPSSHVGLQPQLLEADVTQNLGVNVGRNIVQTAAPPALDANGKLKLDITTYQWYAGDTTYTPDGNGVRFFSTPIEFGGFGLLPADKIKQGEKSLVGAMVIVPKGATVKEDAYQHAQASITANGTTYRDAMVVMAKDLDQRYKDGSAVQHMNGEAVGIPEDSQESSGMALNYGIEPLWFRFGILPSAPFGNAGSGPDTYGGLTNVHQAYSNSLVGGDPVTPVITAKAGQETRIHWAVPHGTSRGSTFKLHGHSWQRAPYVCNGQSRNGLTGACDMGGIGSTSIGTSPYKHYFSGQDSLTPMSHFTFRLEKAGGEWAIPGDYLFRDLASFGNASGLWGILRVNP